MFFRGVNVYDCVKFDDFIVDGFDVDCFWDYFVNFVNIGNFEGFFVS